MMLWRLWFRYEVRNEFHLPFSIVTAHPLHRASAVKRVSSDNGKWEMKVGNENDFFTTPLRPSGFGPGLR
jgi:hypothetical protein